MRKQIYRFIIVLILISSFVFLSSQANINYSYREYQAEINFVRNYKQVDSKEFVDVEESLPKGYVRDGSVDYTEYVQQLLNRNSKVKLPDFPLMVNDNGLSLNSNTTLLFQKNSIIIQKPGSKSRTDKENIKEWYDILRIYGKYNVSILNPQIIGHRRRHKGTEGEWGAGIGIRNSKNIVIENALIKDTWGDGIFVGSEDGGMSEDIKLRNIIIDYSRRTGIAITSARNVNLSNAFIANINGTEPCVGLDLEPSWNKDVLDHIVIKNVKTFNCSNIGFAISLDQLSVDIVKRKSVNIDVNGFIDKGSRYSFGYFINSSNSKLDPVGKITLHNLKLIDPTNDFIKKSYNQKSLILQSSEIIMEKEGAHKQIQIK